jgi:hypothetical protein
MRADKALPAKKGERRRAHRFIANLCVGVFVLAAVIGAYSVSYSAAPGRTKTGLIPGGGLWVANSAGPNVLQFRKKQTNAKGVINRVPHFTLNSGVFTNPQDTLFDASNDLWVVDGGNGAAGGQGIFEFGPNKLSSLRSTNKLTPIFSITKGTAGVPNFVFPQFAVFDGTGDLYVEDTGGNLIYGFTAAQLTSTSGVGLTAACIFSSTAFNGPLGAVFDSTGNLFVAQNGDTTIVRINAADLALTPANCPTGVKAIVPEVILSSTTPTPPAPPSINGPWGLALGKDGTLWVSNEQNVPPNNVGPGSVVAFAAADITTSGTPTPTVTLTTRTVRGVNTISDPQGISFDLLGNLAVSNTGDNTISIFTPKQLAKGGNQKPRTFINGGKTGLNAPTGLIFGPDFR